MDIVHSHAVKNEVEGLGNFAGDPNQYFYPGGEVISVITERFTQSVTIIQHGRYTVKTESIEFIFIAVIMDIVHSHAVKNEVEGLGNFAGDPNQYFYPG